MKKSQITQDAEKKNSKGSKQRLATWQVVGITLVSAIVFLTYTGAVIYYTYQFAANNERKTSQHIMDSVSKTLSSKQ